MPLNEKVIGKRYQMDPIEIKAHESIYYALACDEDNDAYFDNRRKGGIIAPPMYAVFYTAGIVTKIILDSEIGLNFLMVVHYSQEFIWSNPLRPQDIVTTEGIITHIEVRKKGGILGWETIAKNQHGEEVVRSKLEFFDRSAGSDSAIDPKRDEVKPGEILWNQAVKVHNGQTYIYAEPSGDHNPIHIDDAFAKKVGLPGIILQGLCTMAFGHKAAVDNLCGPDRDPMRIKRYRVQFSRPVIPGQTITFQGYRIGDADCGVKHGIIARNNEGTDVLRDSWCVVG
jgi:acyl dehydratase